MNNFNNVMPFSVYLSLSKDYITANGLKKAKSLLSHFPAHTQKNVLLRLLHRAPSMPIRLCIQYSKFPLSFPLLDHAKEHSEKYWPFLVPTPSELVDEGRKTLLVCGKVRCVITCGEYHKLRCLYFPAVNWPQKMSIKFSKDSNSYTCDAQLFAAYKRSMSERPF